MVAIIMIKLFVAFYMIMMGAIVATSIDLQQAYGLYMEGVGYSVMTLGLAKPVNAVLGQMGTTRHNKTLLTLHLLGDIVIVVTQFSLGMTIVNTLTPVAGPETRQDCLRADPQLTSEENCDEYLLSDRTAGMRLVWLSYFSQAVVDPKYSDMLTTIQDEGECCGFGPPAACEEDERAFPSDRSLEDVHPDLTVQRRSCGDISRWYTKVDPAGDSAAWSTQFAECIQVDDEASIYSACMYDLPVGGEEGCSGVLDVNDAQPGCASSLEEYMNSKIDSTGYLLLIMLIVEFFAILTSCCFCMKRKAADIMPNYLDSAPWDPYTKENKAFRMNRAAAMGKDLTEIDPTAAGDPEDGAVVAAE